MSGPHDNEIPIGEVGERRRLIHPPVMNCAISLDHYATNDVVTVVDALPDADGNVLVAGDDGVPRKVFHACLGRAL